jgi:hypothetical protein
MTNHELRDVTPSAFQTGISEAISTWSSVLEDAYALHDDHAVEQALVRLELAVRLGRQELVHHHRRRHAA